MPAWLKRETKQRHSRQFPCKGDKPPGASSSFCGKQSISIEDINYTGSQSLIQMSSRDVSGLQQLLSHFVWWFLHIGLHSERVNTLGGI